MRLPRLEEMARKDAAKREEKRRQDLAQEQLDKKLAAAAEAEKRRKLEEEADDIFNRALVPRVPARDRTRSPSRRCPSRSISSRTARRITRNNRAPKRPGWQESSAAGIVTGSRAIFLNRDFEEDLPHMPRPAAPGTQGVSTRRPAFASKSRSRSRDRRRRK